MKSRWIVHKNKRVFLADFSGFGVNAVTLQAEIDVMLAALRKELPHSVLALSMIQGTIATPDTFSALKRILQVTNEYVRKRVVVGLSPSQMPFLDIVNRLTGKARMKHFPTAEEALDWLVQE